MVAKASTRKPEKKVERAVETPRTPETVKTPFETFVDHERKAITEGLMTVESLLPDAAKEHGEAALKEMTEGYRTLFNTMIDDIIETITQAKVSANTNVDQAIEDIEKIKIE
jgi:hypothetical protein